MKAYEYFVFAWFFVIFFSLCDCFLFENILWQTALTDRKIIRNSFFFSCLDQFSEQIRENPLVSMSRDHLTN